MAESVSHVISQELTSGLSWHQVFGYMSRRFVKPVGSLLHKGKVSTLLTILSAFRCIIAFIISLTYFKSSCIAGALC